MLRSLIPFQLTFVQAKRDGFRFNLLYVGVHFPQRHLLKGQARNFRTKPYLGKMEETDTGWSLARILGRPFLKGT